jgi:hypothetical protein
MSSDRLPEIVDALLRECVYTFDELEVLLLLQQDRARERRLADIAAAVRLGEPEAAAVLAALVDRQLVSNRVEGGSPGYTLAAGRPDRDQALAALAAVAAESRLGIIRVMNANAVERLRTKAARAFSDAFLMRNRRDNG